MKFSTYEGGTITVRRAGHRFDFEVKDPKGETTATVEMSSDDAWSLLSELGAELNA
ncbi:hypothetical protein ACGFYT_29970 [Streptomyces sp. NPDC048208]|uniref:hypothetical protein n=1 Tax=Streptomyces sp. NPDC048208 TaxID=3365515 RepID=UPI003717ACB5